ncbi:MAG: FecR family protein [Mucilaginibacter sp.]
MEKRTFLILLDKYLAGKASPEEERLLEEYYRRLDKSSDLELSQEEETALQQLILRNIWEQIGDESKVIPMKPRRNLSLWYAAASIVIVIGVGGYYVRHKVTKPAEQLAQLKPGTFKNDALPGNKAILTLANGQRLALTSIPAGHIQNTNVQKTSGGALVYDQSDAAPDVFNTLTVPRGGGKHELRLADGTLAVLDAGSSIRFPVAFNGNQRQVEITGQVYFEVVHNATKPFSVKANGTVIRDLGTHFNINAFSDEPEVKTTLLEGSIAVSAAGNPATTLKPGQQAVVSKGTLSIRNNVDVSEVIAWKNDMFKFGKDTPLQTVMNQLSRWYDMDLVYQGTGKVYHFGGDMPRYSKLSDVLKILTYSGVQFSVEGKKIIVYE